MEPLTLSNQRFPRFLNCHSHIQFLQLKVIQDILAKSKNVSPTSPYVSGSLVFYKAVS